MNNIYLASLNKHKQKEIESFLQRKILLPPSKLSYVENGSTLYENAYTKAKTCFELTHESSLSDDSGLFLKNFPHLLGVHTALFHEKKSCFERSKELLKLLSQEEEATFKTVLCLYLNSKEIYFFEGEKRGLILNQIHPGVGFGFDFVFKPEDHLQTYSQDPSYKQNFGHRALALKRAKEFLDNSGLFM